MSKNQIHIDRLKAIRPYVNFNYNINQIKKGNLNSYDKRKIKEYYDELKELTSQPRYKYRPKSKQREKLAREFTGQSNRSGFKYILLPADEQNKKPKLKFNKDSLKIEFENVITGFIPIDKDLFIKDPRKAAQKAIKQSPNANGYGLHLGQFESINYVGNANYIEEEIVRFANDYKAKRISEWLTGIHAHNFNKQADFSDYLNAKDKARKDHQRKRANARKSAKKNNKTTLAFSVKKKIKR